MVIVKKSTLICSLMALLATGINQPAGAQQINGDKKSEAPDAAKGKQALLESYNARALAAANAQRYSEAAELYVLAFAQDARVYNSAYNAACAYALAGKADDTFVWLEKSVQAGYADTEHAKEDAELASLHTDARWQPWIKKLAAKAKRNARLWDADVWKSPYREQLPEDERIAGLSRLWSEVKYNFIYTETLLDLDWDAVYLKYLPQVRAAKNTAEYYRVLTRMMALLKDGHSGVYPPEQVDDTAFALAPFKTQLIEGRVLITEVSDAALRARGVLPGVEVLRVNGQDVKTYAESQLTPYASASTPQNLAVRIYQYDFLSGAIDKIPVLSLQDASGKTWNVKLRRITYAQKKQAMPNGPAYSWKMLDGDVAYVALNSFGDDVAATSYLRDFPEISKAKAIIFDLRKNGGGNTGVGYKILSTLSQQAFAGSHAETRDYKPSYRAWGRVQRNYEFASNSIPADKQHQYSGKVAVLTSANTFSAAEDFAVAFDTMQRGPIIGEPTGGSTGQPLEVSLPGGGVASICTKKDTYPDGKLFVGVGVQPHQLVQPTLADFRSGKDAVLEAALATLLK